MSYIVLIIVFSLISLFIIKKNNDILRPQVVYALSMLICIICAFIGLFFWNDVKNLKLLTIIIILVSFFSFIFGCFICDYLFERKSIELKNNNFIKKRFNKFLKLNKRQKYDLKIYFIIFEIIFVLITIILMYKEVRRISFLAGYDGNGFSNMISKFRELSILYTTEFVENGQGISFSVSQMRKICEVLCAFNIFLIVNTVINKYKIDYKFYLYLIIVFLCIILSIFTGGRMQLFIYILSFAFLYLFIKHEESKSYKFIRIHIKKIIVICLLILGSFYVLLPLSGRSTKTNIVSYMSFYFGTSIPSLNKYIDMDHDKPKYFGEETLRGIHTVLYKLKIANNITPISKEWVVYKDGKNNDLSSNIFTSAKRYYHDFGFIGIIICQLIFGFVFSFMHYLAKKSNFILTFYSMYFYICVDQIRDELFFADFIHINMIFKFVIMLLLFSTLSVIKKEEIKNAKQNS